MSRVLITTDPRLGPHGFRWLVPAWGRVEMTWLASEMDAAASRLALHADTDFFEVTKLEIGEQKLIKGRVYAGWWTAVVQGLNGVPLEGGPLVPVGARLTLEIQSIDGNERTIGGVLYASRSLSMQASVLDKTGKPWEPT